MPYHLYGARRHGKGTPWLRCVTTETNHQSAGSLRGETWRVRARITEIDRHGFIDNRRSFPHGVGRRRRWRSNNLEDDRADLECIADLQRTFAEETGAVDQSSVGTAQIPDQQSPVVLDLEQAMLPADQFTVGPDMAFRSTAEDELPWPEAQAMAARLAVQDLQVDVHVEILSQAPGTNQNRHIWDSTPLCGNWEKIIEMNIFLGGRSSGNGSRRKARKAA